MNNISHLFEVEGRKYLLDYKKMIFCNLNDNDYQNVRKYFENKNNNFVILEDSLNILNEIIKNGIFYTKDTETLLSVPDFYQDVLNISFAPVHNCNFLCKYCYAEGGYATSNYKKKFNRSKIDRMLRYIYLEKYYYYKKYKFDFVSGGEPLLNFSILEYFLESMRSISNSVEKETAVLIVTNGSLITREKLEILDKYDVYVGISIDGPEHIHNNHRIYKNGSGTFKDVLNGIEVLHKSNVSSKLKNAWAMSVIARDTESLVEIMETCYNLGFRRMQMQLLRAKYNSPLSIRMTDIPSLKKKYIELIEHIISFVEIGNLSRVIMIANDNDSFGKFIRRILLRYPVYCRCSAGKNKISITAEGNIYPCDSFCGNNNFCIGSIYNKYNNLNVIKQFKNAHCNNSSVCSKCWGRYICGGDCYYNSFLVNKNILEPDPVICEINLFFIELTIDMLTRIQKINPEYIKYLSRFLQ